MKFDMSHLLNDLRHPEKPAPVDIMQLSPVLTR